MLLILNFSIDSSFRFHLIEFDEQKLKEFIKSIAVPMPFLIKLCKLMYHTASLWLHLIEGHGNLFLLIPVSFSNCVTLRPRIILFVSSSIFGIRILWMLTIFIWRSYLDLLKYEILRYMHHIWSIRFKLK